MALPALTGATASSNVEGRQAMSAAITVAPHVAFTGDAVSIDVSIKVPFDASAIA